MTNFIEILKKEGYDIKSKKLSGGFVNGVQLITARKGDEFHEYVLKKYGSERDFNDSFRGYDLISSKVKTPTIVYTNKDNHEVAYDLVRGKSLRKMIEEEDPRTRYALKKLAKELEILHKSRAFSPRYEKGDSPDEKKLRRNALKVAQQKNISPADLHKLEKQIRAYIPDNKRLIHGDAHLGNFIFSKGEVYIIDNDNAKISDSNADLGKVVYAIDQLHQEGKITQGQCRDFKSLFLENYEGEDIRGVKLHSLRTPLIEMKGKRGDSSIYRHIIRRGLEGKFVGVISAGLILAGALANPTLTGNVIGSSSSLSVSLILIGVIGLGIYFINKFRKSN